uniref:Uncharacterized protein n=1 Tax=Cacopsylla melanoneura TaxID=428564 RepID=A0A8D9ERF3_9HEMI
MCSVVCTPSNGPHWVFIIIYLLLITCGTLDIMGITFDFLIISSFIRFLSLSLLGFLSKFTSPMLGSEDSVVDNTSSFFCVVEYFLYESSNRAKISCIVSFLSEFLSY